MKLPSVIFEDGSFLVLEKPAGVVVNRLTSSKGETIQDWLQERLRIKEEGKEGERDFCQRAGLVHRLDKETSGLLLAAKTSKAFKDLQRQFKKREIGKKYFALVHGRVTPKKGVIEALIGRHPFNRKKFGVFLEGREARTEYRVLSILKREEKKEFYSFLEVKPKTGRTHQIRVHLKYFGYPLVGDRQYGGRKTARADRNWCPRHFLHAFFLSLKHPQTGRRMEFVSPLPSQLRKVLATLHR